MIGLFNRYPCCLKSMRLKSEKKHSSCGNILESLSISQICKGRYIEKHPMVQLKFYQTRTLLRDLFWRASKIACQPKPGRYTLFRMYAKHHSSLFPSSPKPQRNRHQFHKLSDDVELLCDQTLLTIRELGNASHY